MRSSLFLSTLGALMLFAIGCEPPSPWVRTADLGGNFGCYIDTKIDGTQCWGSNNAGQRNVPVLMAPTTLAAGSDFACVLDNDELKCWGNVPSGALILSNPTSIAAGDDHVCVLDDNGVSCLGDTAQTTVPILNRPSAISASGDRACAIDTIGVICWGDNSDSIALTGATKLATGANHVCALANGQIHCAGTETDVTTNIPLVSNPIAIDASTGYTCVIDDEGTQCWGMTGLAAIDDIPDMTCPTEIMTGGNGSQTHACVRHLQGIKCWGDNNAGQTGVYDINDYHGITRGEAEIEATPAEIWAVLMDLDSYPSWNPFTIGMESTLVVGDPMVMQVQFWIGVLEQAETIRLREDEYKVCWGIDGNAEQVTGERCQWMELLDNGNTLYITEDLIEGSLAPITYRLFGTDLIVGFQGVADGLKAYVEGL